MIRLPFRPAPAARSTLRRIFCLAALLVGFHGLPAYAGPVEDAKAWLDEGDDLMKKAEKAKGSKRPEALTDAIKKFARAHMLINGQKLQNDAPELLKEIEKRLDDSAAMPEVAALRRDLVTQAVDAAAADELTKAYDHLAAARDLDPRDRTVEYALRVIGQRMGDN
ncbi:MAG: hypothetical protein R3F60_24490 [bacterium]